MSPDSAASSATEPIYHHDAYQREFEATVVAVDPAGVILDRTAFFPGGGGQPADRGVLLWNGIEHPLGDVLKRGEQVLHRLATGDPPAPGTRVSGRLDWEHRHALMRTHTALHILCGVIWRDFGAQVTGSNMKPLSARMDFELEGMPADLARTFEERVAEEIAADREIKVSFLPREEAFAIPDLIRTKINLLPASIPIIRIVDIVGLDLQADGGTHVANTREVGRIRVTGYESKGRINKRIRIAVEDA